jgi:hypothetical protein
MWTFEDARMPTDAERKNLSYLMYMAFCELRMLSLRGHAERAKDLAEAFHNIPLLMFTDEFSFQAFKEFLTRYQEKHKETAQFNYLQEWEKLTATT